MCTDNCCWGIVIIPKSPFTSQVHHPNVIRIYKEPEMAHVLLNPILKSISGRMGPVVLYHYNDRQYMRRYVVPRNSHTPEQTKRRKTFADAVSALQTLAEYKKTQWNHRELTLPMSGYNLYISKQMTSKEESVPVETVLKVYSCAPPPVLPASHSVYDGIPDNNRCYLRSP